MKWIDRLETKLGHLAIPGLLRWIALANVVVFILFKLYPGTFQLLALDQAAVLRGEVWRLVTYIFIPGIFGLIPLPDWFNAAIFILFMWWVGDGLDNAWSPFRTNLFYLLGMIGTTIAAFVFGTAGSNAILNSSVFLAFARFYGDEMIYMFYVLPMKVKWVAWFTAAMLFLNFVPAGLAGQAALAASLINYLIFFGPEIIREAKMRGEVRQRRARFESAMATSEEETLHRCTVCGRTEASAPDLDFRVSRDGNEYCLEHLPKTPAAK